MLRYNGCNFIAFLVCFSFSQLLEWVFLGAQVDSGRGKDPTLSSACHWQHYLLSSTKGRMGTGGPWEDDNTLFLQPDGAPWSWLQAMQIERKISIEKGVVGVERSTGPYASCRDMSWEPIGSSFESFPASFL